MVYIMQPHKFNFLIKPCHKDLIIGKLQMYDRSVNLYSHIADIIYDNLSDAEYAGLDEMVRILEDINRVESADNIEKIIDICFLRETKFN